jgi:L-iditol 2-dehydrogenase
VAKQLGIQHTMLIDAKLDIETLEQQVIKLLGDSPDITLECSGAELSLTLAISATKDGGNVVMVGIGPAKVTIPLSSAAAREVNLLGILRYRNTLVF